MSTCPLYRVAWRKIHRFELLPVLLTPAQQGLTVCRLVKARFWPVASLLSYLVQGSLSARLKYRSLYEAQVQSRADSPAHHVEHLQIALRLVGRRQIPAAATLGHLDLIALLEAGIPVDLPNGKQLSIGILQPHSSCVSQAVQSDCLVGAHDDAEIVALLRQGQLLLPAPELLFQADDQVVLILSSPIWERMAQHLSPLSVPSQSPGQSDSK